MSDWSGTRRRHGPGRARARGPGVPAHGGGQGRRRPGRGGDRPGDRADLPRPRAAGGRARRREDAARPHVLPRARPADDPGPVHARPDARRRHGLARLRRPRGGVLVPPGPGLHEPAAGGRDQPDAAEDAGLPAGGDGGAAGLGGRGAPPTARAVHGRRDPEPGRVRGHVPAARRPSSTGSCSSS